MSIEKTLKERGEKYGSFEGYVLLCNQLKAVALLADNGRIQPLHSEGLDMIFNKIARILNGDPNYADNWHDIAGYAILVENELKIDTAKSFNKNSKVFDSLND